MKVVRKVYRFLRHQTHEDGSPLISAPKHLDPKYWLLMPLNWGEK